MILVLVVICRSDSFKLCFNSRTHPPALLTHVLTPRPPLSKGQRG
jgi:hypothetical protein